MACVSTKIEVELARLDLCPVGHSRHTTILNDLSIAFLLQYDQLGNISDLNRAVEIDQTRLNLCPPGHPEHTHAVGQLAISLWHHYSVQKNKQDINNLVEMEQQWLDLCPYGHPDHGKALSMLALSLWERFELEEEIEDLNRSIEIGEKRLGLSPVGHVDHAVALNNLALSLASHYQKTGDITSLNRAIDLQEEYLELCPPGYQTHGLGLRNLALSLWCRYDKMGNLNDLVLTSNLFKDALQTYPVQHQYFAFNAGELAAVTLLLCSSSSSSSPSDQPFPSLDEAFETYRLLKKCGPTVSLDLLHATQEWIKNAERHNHSSVLEAYQTFLNIVDDFTSFTCSLDLRHGAMQARVADLANNAFSCGTRHGNFKMAVQFLEQGRGILWNQLARFDISVAALESSGNQECKLARKFVQLSVDLRKHAQQSGGNTSPYWQAQEEWQSVVDKIRRLDGFSRFLLPPCFEDLQQAAEHGPVIIVNASVYACDALIVLHAREPVHVDLPCSLPDVNQLRLQLSELTQDVHAYGNNRESWVKQMLRELWSSVVKPIVSVLQNDVQLPPGSRIWWCPTSKFTILPFHAAGPHRKAEKNIFDIYVSSYAPSLSALLRARDRIRSQKAERNKGSGVADVISFAAVGQGRPSTDTKLGELPEVEHEILKIRDTTGMPPEVKFETVTGAAATIEGAVQAFRDHRWVHVACHGAQHAEKPFESWFAMRDGKLTLMRIIQERYTNSEFAFLSACHTAVGDESTPDEVLHLAAGMQFAGFNGVIGTLWKVDDALAHKVVTRFYGEMFRHPTVDFEHAAAALNTAVVETASEVSLEKRIVFVHIGI